MKKHIACLIVGLLLLVFTPYSQASEASKLDITLKQRQYLLLQQKSLTQQLQELTKDSDLSRQSINESLQLLERKRQENQHSYHILKQQLGMDQDELVLLKKHMDSPTTVNKEHFRRPYEELQSRSQSTKSILALYQDNSVIIQKIQARLEEKQRQFSKDKRLLERQKVASENQIIIQALSKEVDGLLTQKIALEESTDKDYNYRQTATELLSLEQNVKQLVIEYLSLKNKFINFSGVLPQSASLSIITQHLNELKARKESFKTINRLFHNNSQQLATIDAQIKSLNPNDGVSRKEIKALSLQRKKLQSFIHHNEKQIDGTLASLSALIEKIEHERAKKVSTRQTLLSYDKDELLHVFTSLMRLPSKFILYLQSLYDSIETSFSLLSVAMQLLILAAIGVIFSLWLLGHSVLKMKAFSDSLPRSKNLYVGILRVINRNFGSICIFSSLLLVFYVCNISYNTTRLVISLFVTWFCFRGLLSITRLILIENESQIDGNDVALFYRLRIALIAGGVVTILMIMSHELNLVKGTHFLSQLFMLFLLSVAIVLLRARDTLYVLLKSLFHVKRFYVKRALSLLLILSPLALMINALVGLWGFSLIAWEVSYYLLIVVLGLSSYVIVRGVINDLLDMTAKLLITHSKNGWFWGEAFLKPLNSLINALLLIGLVVILFFLFGLSKQERVLNFALSIWHYQLFRYSKADITIGSFIEFSFLVMVFIWLTRWSRECCYRWVYRYVKDQGIRNSLSAFTQYAVVSLGFIITLRVLGVDISGVSMILGGLAVGMGFGLRDFANNIVGGLMLLIERPVKEGDLISIDNTEGRVIHIGIRSMRVRSWDHLEVLIPNSETFSKPFTNWTHQDSVVRTVITIKVSREDSATKVQNLILEVLDIIPEVLKSPEPQVYLKHIDEALLEFEVRYFINIEENSRMSVRSIVLFAITAQFTAAGIKAPIPPVSIENLTPCRG